MSDRDREHLDEFCRFVDYTGPVRTERSSGYSSPTPIVSVTLNSRQLWRRLLGLGVTPRKSFVGHPVPTVRPLWAYALFRGYFDGNGCITFVRNRYWHIGVVGRPMMMRWIAETIRRQVGPKEPKIGAHRGCSTLAYGAQREVAAIGHWMYGGLHGGTGLPSLARKRVKFLDLFDRLDLGHGAHLERSGDGGRALPSGGVS